MRILDPNENSWSEGIPLPNPVSYAGAITVDGKIYVIGGVNQSDTNNNFSTVFRFDPILNQWTTMASTMIAKRSFKLVYFQGRIWKIGGHTNENTNSVHSFDPISNTWRAEKASFN